MTVRIHVSGDLAIASPANSSREWVAIDLETTGLSDRRDAIIEVGAVRFTTDRTLDEFQTFVNPRRKLQPFIRSLTGITQKQVDDAPSFSAVAPEFERFIRGATPVLHNAPFDLGFLRRNGVEVTPRVCDTWELAYLARPSAGSYALEELVYLLGIESDGAHRALADARAVRDVLLTLLPELARLDPTLLDEYRRLSDLSGWDVDTLLNAVEELAPPRPALSAPSPPSAIGGIDTRELSRRLARPKAIQPEEAGYALNADMIADALSAGNGFARRVPNFEERPEQRRMAAAVADKINAGGKLMVEAGTGVGKSLAYLLPAALYAVRNGARVVVSTATIALQEQLISKDLPMVKDALAEIDPDAADQLRFTSLKGRSNYLCYKRWNQARRADDVDEGAARVIAKTLGWLPDTQTGDRGEINLGHYRAAASWDRLSASRALECPAQSGGPCFLRAARQDAAASHIVVVNHALLISDLVAGGSAIPDYGILIMDEAHNLEDQATDQLAFTISNRRLNDVLDELTGERGLLFRGRVASSRVSDDKRRDDFDAAHNVIQSRHSDLRAEFAQLLARVSEAAPPDRWQRQSDYASETRITEKSRASDEWDSIAPSWQNAEILIADLAAAVVKMRGAFVGIEPNTIPDQDSLTSDLERVGHGLNEIRAQLGEILSDPQETGIYWVRRERNSTNVILNRAPLHVGDTLNKLLYEENDTVILTSATLTIAGSLDHAAERLGLADAEQLVLGSPFDYYNSALLYAPRDVPDPRSPDFQSRVEREVADAAIAAGGRTMALFTSYAALTATANAIKGPLARAGISVIAQSGSTSNRITARRFMDEPRSVLLGTSSFWEGVDFPGDALTVLVVARLPFPVPSDPIVQARSEQYDNGFMGYLLPQAALKFRQGFGRLIRSTTDRGVVMVLDSRIVNSRYGRQFIESLPNPRQVKPNNRHPTANIIRLWLETAP